MAEDSERKKPARQGTAWQPVEERALYDGYDEGLSVNALAEKFERSRGGIVAHLKKLGVLDEDGAPVDPVPPYTPTDAVAKRSQKQAEGTARRAARMADAEPEPSSDANPQLDEALRQMHGDEPLLFITGKAGTGKSTLLRRFRRKTARNLAVVAPTGIAALNVGGQTIHNFFRFGIDASVHKIETTKKVRNPKLYANLEILVIDEISMVRADMLDCIETFLRMHGPHRGEAFGGVRIVFMGDLYQLPPVVKSQDREIFTQHYPTPYFFSARCMQDRALPIVELEKIYRQKDMRFAELLNRVRDGSADDGDLAMLNGRVGARIEAGGHIAIHLTGTNKAADRINHDRLESLPGRLLREHAAIEGDFGKEYFPAASELVFKIGAQVMMVVNDRDGRWVNGSIGTIAARGVEDGVPYVSVDLDDSETVPVKPFTWEVFKYAVVGDKIESDVAGTFAQYPFRLAWAVTIHKSQGKTFERVSIDLSEGAFAAGQAYVALSRCTTLDGMALASPLRRRDIQIDPRIRDFLRGGSHAISGVENMLHDAVAARRQLRIRYVRLDGDASDMVVLPVAIGTKHYQGQAFTGVKVMRAPDGAELLLNAANILSIELAS